MRKNEKGGAAAVAIMVIIMIVAVICTVLVVTGRFAIKKTDVENDVKASSSEAESSSEEISETDLSSVAPEPEPVNLYPTKSADYHEIDLDDITCSEAILINADTNEIIAGLNYEKQIYPASLTKILTLMVAVENIDDLKATYKFTEDDIDPLVEDNASMVGFEPGEEVTVEDLLYGTILVSGADATTGLANYISGSEAEFVKLMDQKLIDLGLNNTTKFVNATGLHDKNHYTTVQDVAVLTKAAMESETCKKILTTSSYTTSKTEAHPDGIEMTSIVLSRYAGYYIDTDGDDEGDADMIGGKTGFTDEAMYTMSSIIDKDGTTYICVVAQSEGDIICTEDTIAICENYINYVERKPADAEEEENTDTEEKQDDTEAHPVGESDTIKVGA